jgi:hypothetical protein
MELEPPHNSRTQKRWQDESLPWLMLMRGYFPRWLGGEPVYVAVVRTQHFSSKRQQTEYLFSQHLIAAARGQDLHAQAILKLINA